MPREAIVRPEHFRPFDRPANLIDDYPGSQHVRRIGLGRADDAEVWTYAVRNDLAIVSKDSDFRQRSFLFGQPPKVVWVALGNCSTQDIELLLRERRDQLEQFNGDPSAAFMLLD